MFGVEFLISVSSRSCHVLLLLFSRTQVVIKKSSNDNFFVQKRSLSEIIIIWVKTLSFWTKQVAIWWLFKGIIVAQPTIWSSCCLMKSQRRDKMSKIAILWLFWAYVGQPDGIFWYFFFISSPCNIQNFDDYHGF